jgi:signal transduction histidine kinase
MKILGAVIGTIIVVSVLLATFAGQSYRQTLLQSQLDSLEQTSHERALKVVSGLTRDIEILQRYAASSEVMEALAAPASGSGPAALENLSKEIPQLDAAVLVTPGGDVAAFTSSVAGAASPEPAKWSWFDDLSTMPEGLVLIGGGPDEGLSGIKGVSFALPVMDAAEGAVLGALYVVVDTQRYGAGSNNTDLYLADGTPLGSWLDLNTDVRQTILDTPSGSIISESPPATAYGFVHISDLGVDDLPAGRVDWIVAARYPYQAVLANILPETERLNNWIALAALVLCLAAAGICWLFSRPGQKLAAIADQIATTDNLDLTLPTDSAADLATMSSALNSLMSRLKHRATQLQTAAMVSRENISQDVETLLRRIAGILHKQMNLWAIYIYRMEADGLRAYVEVAEGNAGVVTHQPGTWVILTNKSLVGQALQGNEMQWAQGLIAAFPGAKNQPAEIVIPFHGDAPRALHVVGEPEGFGQFDVNIFRLIASEIGATLENHHLLAEIVAARHEAERASQVKSQFLASVSHELRTPLNSIINFTRFVQRGVMGPTTGEQDEALGKVINSGRHLLNLINDVLDISKIEADALELFIEPNINVSEILNRTLPIAQNLLGEKQVELRMEVDNGLPSIAADAQRILQIVLNLLSNACKFTDTGSIVVSAQQRNGEVIVAVRDTGPGVAPEDYEAVFETFRQTEAGLRHGGGTGLGMPISRRLAEAHGGRLWLESELGKGATFFVALPIESPLQASTTN